MSEENRRGYAPTNAEMFVRLNPYSSVFELICVHLRKSAANVVFLILVLFCASCSHPPDPNTLVMIIESSPVNLDPRVGIDSQSQRIDELLFDSLVAKDDHFNIQPWVAEKWEQPDPLTWVFHLRRGIHFHDGRPLTARDVKWTLDSLRDGTVTTTRGRTFKLVTRVDIPDDATVVIHLSEPFAPLLWNLTSGAFGIVPYGTGKELSRFPVGSGPFKFVSLSVDSEVVIERNDQYWGEHARVPRIRFNVVPAASTRALELRKGSADIAINALTADIVGTLKRDPNLVIMQEPGTSLQYLAFNLRDPLLKDVRVRQALAFAMDREPIQHFLFGDQVRLADSLLPRQHWAYNGDVAHYAHDPARANAMRDAAGYARGPGGVRFHLTMKTSTDETTRLLAATLQQQLREVGIALDIRGYEFATFFSDVVKGTFQLYSLRWVGYSNQDPDIFEDVFHSASFPPKRANRGRYSNPRIDQLIEEGRRTDDVAKRKVIYGEIQTILATDLPYIDLWYYDNVLVHTTRVRNLHLGPAGNFGFLTQVELAH